MHTLADDLAGWGERFAAAHECDGLIPKLSRYPIRPLSRGEGLPISRTTRAGKQIDAAEKDAGEPQGRPRVKFTRVDELLDAAGARRCATRGVAAPQAQESVPSV